MIILFFSLYVLIVTKNFQTQNTLYYNILDYGETVSLSLANYLNAPMLADLDKVHSSDNIDALYTQFNRNTILQISSLTLTAKFADGSDYQFNPSNVLQTYTIYNQPNKIFLMKNNILLSVRYQFTTSDQISSLTVKKIDGSINCTEVGSMQVFGNYYIVIGCLKNETLSVLYPFRFDSTNPADIHDLVQLRPINVLFNATCLKLGMYSFRQFAISKQIFNNSILYFCSQNAKHEESIIYFLTMNSDGSTGQFLKATLFSRNDLPVRDLKKCLKDCSWACKYEQGLLIKRNDSMKYFRYNINDGQSNCEDFFAISEPVVFIDSVSDEDIQNIYFISNNQIIIKESYAPNFQTIQIWQAANMTIHSYAIARKFLILQFVNETHNKIVVYDLVKIYPSLIDQAVFQKNQTAITLYSVNNFLQNGNYYLNYDQITKKLSLNYYQGYLFTFSVKDTQLALPKVTINISDQQSQNLIIQCSVRSFNDTSIVQTSGSNFQIAYRDILVINLTDYASGPLGKFYNYPNNISAFQYINDYSEVNISSYIKSSGIPLAISFNNYLNAAIINFYYAYLVNTCQLYFDSTTKLTSLSDCKTLKRKKYLLDNPNQIVILSEDKYIQYNSSITQYCSLSPNNQFQCIKINIQLITSFNKIKLVKYAFSKNTDQIIQLFIYNSQEIIYCCLERKAYSHSDFIFRLHYHTNSTNLPDLDYWKIQEIFFDSGYQQFLALHLVGLKNDHRVMVFDKPIASKNATSFIGHTIQTLNYINLQGVFCINNLLISIYLINNTWIIQQYKITKYYKVKQTRKYPLFNYIIKIMGDHHQDGQFIYLDAFYNNNPIYLVYSPLKTATGVLSHQFNKRGRNPLIFAQQIGQVNQNSMGLNNDILFGVVEPILLFKFLSPQAKHQHSMGRYEFQVSVLDTINKMTLLLYKFDYNQGEQSIKYNSQLQISLEFKYGSQKLQFIINPEYIQGPVNNYRLQLPDNDNCSYFKIESKDIFTKKGCLVYTNPDQFGTLSDFLAISYKGINLQLVVTDQSILCVLNRRVYLNSRISINGSINCKFEADAQNILMICENATSIGKFIYNVTVTATNETCAINVQNIKLPKWITYGDFSIKFSGIYIIFDVPIRYRQNCIYYKGIITDNQIMQQNNSILVGGQSTIQSQFNTKDTSISSQLFFILENGIGIYNLSDWANQIKPALWLTQKDIFQDQYNNNQSLIYLKYLNSTTQCQHQYGQNISILNIQIELGTQPSAYEINIKVLRNLNISTNQTIFTKLSVQILYQYKQYMSCHNTLQSKSQSYGNLIIKICNYAPPDELVFANFISISNQTTGALIQFYNRSGQSSYPYRIDTIYSNFQSHHSFIIRQNTLIVASLFNLLCYYALSTTLVWQISYEDQKKFVFDSQKIQFDKLCQASIIIYNLEFEQKLTLSMTYNDDQQQSSYWTNGSHYIQRSLILLILANTIRLVWKNRKSKNSVRLRKKLTGRLHTNKFEVMVKINSKING